MELKEYHYVYYSYEEYGRGYFGSRTCRCLPEEDVKYFGSFSDKNFKPTQKIILKSDYATREEAYADEITLHHYYNVANNPHFANKAYQTSSKFHNGMTTEKARELGNKTKELGIGIHSLTYEQRSEYGKKATEIAKELGVGLYGFTKEQRSEYGKKSKELGVGIFSYTKKQLSENGYNGGKKAYEMKVGVHALTKEQMSENSKKIASQKWKCLETGFISNAGGLACYQRKRNIDTSKRVRIS